MNRKRAYGVVVIIIAVLAAYIGHAGSGDAYNSDEPEKFDYETGDYATVPAGSFNMQEAEKHGRLRDVTVSQWGHGDNLESADDISEYPAAKMALQNKHPSVASIEGSCAYKEGVLIGSDGSSQDLHDANLEKVKVDSSGHVEITSKQYASVDVDGRKVSGTAKSYVEGNGRKFDMAPESELSISQDGSTRAGGSKARISIEAQGCNGVETSSIYLGSPSEVGSATIHKKGQVIDVSLENAMMAQQVGAKAVFDEGAFDTKGKIRYTDNPELLGHFYEGAYEVMPISGKTMASGYIDLYEGEEWVTYTMPHGIVSSTAGGTTTYVGAAEGPLYISVGGDREPFRIVSSEGSSFPEMNRYSLEVEDAGFFGFPKRTTTFHYEQHTDARGEEISHSASRDTELFSDKKGNTRVYSSIRYINIGPGDFFAEEPRQVLLCLSNQFVCRPFD